MNGILSYRETLPRDSIGVVEFLVDKVGLDLLFELLMCLLEAL